jgi:hypothetical protein
MVLVRTDARKFDFVGPPFTVHTSLYTIMLGHLTLNVTQLKAVKCQGDDSEKVHQ